MVSPLTGSDQRPVSQARLGRELGLEVPHRVWWLTPPPILASSLGEVLTAIRPWISKELLDGPGWERMLAVARGLPADAANYQFGFEYALRHSSSDADLADRNAVDENRAPVGPTKAESARTRAQRSCQRHIRDRWLSPGADTRRWRRQERFVGGARLRLPAFGGTRLSSQPLQALENHP